MIGSRTIRAVLDLAPFGHLELSRPVAVLRAGSLGEVRAVLRRAEAEARGGRWVAGLVAYEAAPAFDDALRVRPAARGPLAWFAAFDRPEAGSEAGDAAALALDPARLSRLEPEVRQEEHAGAVERIRAALGRGDAYQVNLTFRLRGRFEGEPLALYRRLHAAQGGCRSVLLQDGPWAVASASPELFFERRGDRLTVRPMKGTAPRGRYAEEDEGLAAALAASEKERAENVMIADLMRNDVGRVARVGSVEVTRLCAVERYRTVHQMTSTVEGRLRPETTLEAIFAALFPCGSVTGAPKASAMGIIAAEERSPRGAYCGAVGVLAPGGDAAFNVAIRTVELDLEAGAATYGVGGGITWPSEAATEWEEALAKARVLEEPETRFDLLETVRLEEGVIPLLPRHLSRLAESASLLGFRHDPAAARAILLKEAAARPSGGHRLRLRLAEGGRLAVDAGPLPPVVNEPLPVALARTPVSRRDRLLFHKTTRREPYELRRRERPEAFDVILRNEEGELTELGIGNLVLELGGERVTPPRQAGLLGGVFRAELLARGEVRERTVRAADLFAARRLWLVNAVRGWVPIRLVG